MIRNLIIVLALALVSVFAQGCGGWMTYTTDRGQRYQSTSERGYELRRQWTDSKRRGARRGRQLRERWNASKNQTAQSGQRARDSWFMGSHSQPRPRRHW